MTHSQSQTRLHNTSNFHCLKFSTKLFGEENKMYMSSPEVDLTNALFLTEYFKTGSSSFQEFSNLSSMLAYIIQVRDLCYNSISNQPQRSSHDNLSTTDSKNSYSRTPYFFLILFIFFYNTILVISNIFHIFLCKRGSGLVSPILILPKEIKKQCSIAPPSLWCSPKHKTLNLTLLNLFNYLIYVLGNGFKYYAIQNSPLLLVKGKLYSYK